VTVERTSPQRTPSTWLRSSRRSTATFAPVWCFAASGKRIGSDRHCACWWISPSDLVKEYKKYDEDFKSGAKERFREHKEMNTKINKVRAQILCSCCCLRSQTSPSILVDSGVLR